MKVDEYGFYLRRIHSFYKDLVASFRMLGVTQLMDI